MKHEAIGAAKASVPVAYLSTWAAGFSWNEAAAAAAFLFSCMLIVEKACGWFQKWRAKRRK